MSPELVNSKQIRVVERARDARLLLKARHAIRICAERRRQNLDGHFAA